MKIVRQVTEYLLPALRCPCCGAVTTAAAPAAAQPGSVSYGPVINTAAVLTSRRAESITAILSFFTGFLITDGYTAYQQLLPKLAGLQQCCQHYVDTVVMPIRGGWRWLAGVGGLGVSILRRIASATAANASISAVRLAST